RDIQSERAGHCVRSVAAQIFEPAVKGGTNLSIQPVWDSPVYWVNETVISASPWLATPPFSSALSTDWKAVELPTEREQSLNIVHRETMAALQWLAFLAAVLITSRKIFSSPVLIILLLCVTETITRCTADCYVMIPAGIFLGLCVSLGFTLIRSRIVKPEIPLDTSLVKVSDSTEYDKNFVPTAIINRNYTTDILLFVTIICCGTAAAAEIPQKEAYRVFYPIDSEKNITGSEVWLPYEFLKILSQPQRPAAALSSGDVQKHWSIVSSTYRGSLITAEPNFTADFVILLNGSEAEITLGKLPILSAVWDGKAIEAVRRQNGKETVTALMVSNELPGKHTLSVRIGTENLAKNSAGSPGMVNGAAKIIEFPIPKIPNSTLHLNVPADMTGIRFDGICGAVQRTDGSGEYVVDTGAAENISIALDAEKSAFSGTAAALFAAGPAAEEYLWLWAKPAQTELKTLFRLQFDGSQTLLNNVTEISIKTDSRWLLSGQFQCDSVPVSSQTLAGQDGSDVTQITFLSPPSGTVTLRADFVLQDFNGIGNVLMPQFQVLQTKTVKKMLAVSAENNLELVFPPSGQSSGFLSAWYGEGQPGTPSGIRSTALPNTAAPAAQYDITQIGGDWVLGIQAKKILPDVKVQTDVLFDTKESVFVTSGLFETSAGVFQLPFLAASTAAIERVEVRDAQPGPNFDTLLACRYSINAASADTNRGIIFLRRPASGKISVTITGTFTGSGKEPEVFTAVPALVFTNCNVKEHTLNLFRRNSVLTVIQDEPHGWTKPSITPSVPEFFSKGEAVIPLAQYDADSRTAYAAGIAAKQLPVMPKVLVKANEPKLQGETRLTLNQENGSWSIDYGISGEISGGEFTQFRLHWDERCRNILSAGVSFAGNTVQPCNWSWEQTEGRYVLMLSPASFPNKPFTGKIRLNIKAFLAQGTDDVSVPAIFPDIDTSAVQMFVQLPQKNGEETIPWELQYLETYQTKNAANTDGSGKAQLLFRVTDKDYRAKINRTNSAPVITLCDAGFLLRPDGSLLALAAADVKVSGQDTCIVQLPVNSELIQMTRNGTVLRGTQLGNNRWQIDFWGSDYPQRLNILYRSRLRCALPVFEGVKVQETIWTIAKETAGAPPLDYAVQTAQNTSAADNNENTLIDLGRHRFLTGNTAAQSQITMNLIRQHHLLRQLNSLPVSTGRLEEVKRWFTHWSADWNSVSEKINYQTALTANEPNVKPVLLLDWRERQDIDQNASTAAFLETMSAKTRDALQLAKQQSVKEKIDSSSKEPEASVSGSENIGSNVPLLNSQTYWQGRLSGEMVYLFGVSGGAVSEICLTDDSQLSRSTGGIRFWQSILPAQMPLAVQMLLGISLCVFTAIMVMIFLRRIYFTELLLQYPHFWGTALGLFLWSSTPLGGVGIAVTVLTVISLFRPSWHRRKIPKNT
ncbi:MAG: hypothetical protein LBT89_01640, partial [Planctomycetaceae bacterium]|nr:hypothetical protein [Planctomycetaceae bacterium]